MVDARVTQEPVEAASRADSALRVTQAAVEVSSHNGAQVRGTQAAVEVVSHNGAQVRGTQAAVEVLYLTILNCLPGDFNPNPPYAVVNPVETGAPKSSAPATGGARDGGSSATVHEAPQAGSAIGSEPGKGNARVA
jgi:hypothetical protein